MSFSRVFFVCYDLEAMVRSFVRALVAAGTLVVVQAGRALAQAPATPEKGGHPWHWWMALGALVLGGLTLAAAVVGLVVQSPGFKRVQHKQGAPK